VRQHLCSAVGVHPARPKHLKAFPYVGPQRYHLRFSTDAKRPLFSEPAAVDLVREHLERHAKVEEFAVIAYCFMPDHLHLLVQGETERSDCLRLITRLKQTTGFAYSRRFCRRLWQRYGFERVLRENEDTMTVARYILRNPLRAGLVTSVEDYPFAGSLVYPLRTLLLDVAQDGSG
jgi:putative transposase